VSDKCVLATGFLDMPVRFALAKLQEKLISLNIPLYP